MTYFSNKLANPSPSLLNFISFSQYLALQNSRDIFRFFFSGDSAVEFLSQKMKGLFSKRAIFNVSHNDKGSGEGFACFSGFSVKAQK